MRVFISWSGPRSKHIAEALRNWLPKVLQSVSPWMSDDDIAAGSRWLPEVAGELANAKLGILCVTPENQASPWLVFEAGALSKTLEQTFVCPMLFDLDIGQLSGPLAQFQASTLDRLGMQRLLETLNFALGASALPAGSLEEIFEVWWPKLEAQFATTPALNTPAVPRRSSEDVLDEILSLVREQLRRENLRLEHSQARDARIEQILPLIEQMAGAAKDLQTRGADVTSFAKKMSLPPELASLFPTGMPVGKLDDMVRIMREQSNQSRLETLQLLETPNQEQTKSE